MQNKIHVAIAGAGLGGLCLAQALKKHGISFDVYEKDSAMDSRMQGYRIRIDETGQRALAACLPAELNLLFRQTCSVASSEGQFLNTQLEPIQGRPSRTWQASSVIDPQEAEFDTGDRSANRLTLRQVLLAGIEDHVHFNKAIDCFTEEEDGSVAISFTDGATATASVLVAADGINSSVRQQKLPLAQPQDTGVACIYGKTRIAKDSTIAQTLRNGTSVIFADDFAVIIDAMAFHFPETAEAQLSAVDDYLYWAVFGRRGRIGLDEESLQKARGKTLRMLVTQLSQSWAPGLQALFCEADTTMIAALPIRSATGVDPWTSSSVTFLGDAVHAMSPAGGVGANTALADAAALASRLAAIGSEHASLFEAISSYEQDMRQRANAAIAASIEGARNLLREADPV